ncbi:MAG: bifunctional [glutamate--ammonia ligase]-adenylyl-L-tyrosine phosphorylase/[glutamate--ammonia-ligase] adenylyltransferase [Woeseia sp.]
MKPSVEEKLRHGISRLPQVLREPVAPWLGRFLDGQPSHLEQLCAIDGFEDELLRLVACSEYAANTLLREWNWFADSALAGRLCARPDTLLKLAADDDGSVDWASKRLRQCRNRGLLHILWRELNGSADVGETLSSLSTLADHLIVAATRCAEAELRKRFGSPLNSNGRELALVVLAMGKLGGRELNFSSDIDLVFLYPEDGESDGARKLSAHEFFTRLSRRIVALLDEATADGFVYRVDTRLRPFGESGPPVVSFAALESYLLRHGRDWERYAYVKARVVPTGGSEAVEKELRQEIIEPFVFRRYLDYGVFESLRDMKSLIAAEARRRQVAANLKSGPGGIREIEFIVQSFQLVRGGSNRKLKTPELQTALQHLGQTRNLRAADASSLAEAYRFLRRLENFIQAIRDQQTHDLPDNALDRARLSLALGYADWDGLMAALERHRANVSAQFAATAFRGGDTVLASSLGDTVTALWASGASEQEWSIALDKLGFKDRTGAAAAASMAKVIVAFADSASVRQAGTAGSERLSRFLPALLAVLRNMSQPALALRRVLHIVEQILRRSAYVALLIENPEALERLARLCDTSGWLAEEIGRYPLLLDELLDPRLYTAPLTREEMLADLERRLAGLEEKGSEQQVEILGQFQRAAVFRIAVADVTGSLPIMKVSDRLTELAELVLNRALTIAWEDLTVQHGQPTKLSRDRGREALRKAGFGVVAYGKFGGMELSYRSDLDLVFLHDGSGSEQITDGAKPLDNNVFFARLVRRLVHFLTAQTGSGALYQVDTRLRPSGRSGLLVTSVEAFERYQEENAWTWEHQALLRSRAVAGSASVAREFERVRAETLKYRVKRERLLADVVEMREKMRSQLDKSDSERFDLKQGAGGIGDIEFLVQYLVLKNAAKHPAVIHYTDNIRQLGTLAAAGCLAASEVARLQEIYKSYRLCLHRLALDEKPPFAADSDFTNERRYVSELRDRILARGSPSG